ncbi:hypothetical protein TeGR_g13067, partial [Tetraparma gracilis]
APIFWQFFPNFIIHSFGCNGLQCTLAYPEPEPARLNLTFRSHTDLILVYVLFWLQILEVKREQYLKKKAEQEASGKSPIPPDAQLSPKSPKAASAGVDKQKSKKMGQKVLDLARKRHSLMKLAFRVLCVVVSLTLVLSIAAATFDLETPAGRQNHMWCLALIMAIDLMHMSLPLYVLATLGKQQVALYKKKSVTMLYYGTVVLFGIIAVVCFGAAVDNLLAALDENGGWGTPRTWVFVYLDFASIFTIVGSYQVNIFLAIPMKAAKREKAAKAKGGGGGGGGGGTSTASSESGSEVQEEAVSSRRGSSAMILGGLASSKDFNSSKVAPA